MINVSGVSESRVAPAAAYYANQKGVSYIIGGEKGRLQHYILLKKTNAISEMEKKN